MKKQESTFAVETKGGAVQTIGKSVILQPKVAYNGQKTKWFDDSQLIRKK